MVTKVKHSEKTYHIVTTREVLLIHVKYSLASTNLFGEIWEFMCPIGVAAPTVTQNADICKILSTAANSNTYLMFD